MRALRIVSATESRRALEQVLENKHELARMQLSWAVANRMRGESQSLAHNTTTVAVGDPIMRVRFRIMRDARI